MKKTAKFLIQLIVSVIFLYIAFKNIHPDEVKHAFQQVNFNLVLIGTALQFISFAFRGIRWKVLLLPIKPVPFSSAFQILAISYTANNILPFRAGDVLRAVMIGQREQISKVSSFSTVLIEKVLDGLTVLLFLISGLWFLHLENDWSNRTILVSAAIFVGALLFLYLIKRYQQLVTGVLTRLVTKMAGVKIGQFTEGFLEKFLLSLDLIRSRRLLFTLMWTSIIIWSLEASLYVSVAAAFGQPFTTSLLIGIVTVAIVNLGIMIPSSPGYVGTFEFFCIFSMGLFGIDPSTAASYSIIVHLAQYIPITVLGAVLWLLKPFNQRVEDTSL
jgi:uncharacterized protein (TIRG00374 family)